MTEQTEPIQEAVLIERGLYEQMVEGLEHVLYGNHRLGQGCDRCVKAHKTLTQLTEKQS